MSDGWSSLDGSESDSFIASSSDSSSSSSSSSSSCSDSSSSSEVSLKKVVKKKANTPASQRSTTPVTPSSVKDSAKKSRASVLESLSKKRRLSSSSRRAISSEESSLSESSEDFIVSDDQSSYSSGEEQDPGFYARVSHMLDKKDRKDKSFTESFSPRSAFNQLIIYYAICLVSKNCMYPATKKYFQKQLSSFQAAARKIESEIKARRNINKPSYWKPESNFVKILDAFPNLRSFPYRGMLGVNINEGVCDGCFRNNRLSVVVNLGGHAYDSRALWDGNIKKWIQSMKLPFLTESDKDVTSSEEEYQLLEPGTHFNLGGVCASNVRIYHILNHWKHGQLFKLYNWIVSQRLAGDVKVLVARLEDQRDGIVEQWFEEYQQCTSLSEKNCDKFTDPLGSHSPSEKLPNRRKSSAF